VLVTGATGGLGKAFAVECASRGWDLFLTDQRLDALATLASGLQAAYRVQVSWLPCDLTDAGNRENLFETLHQLGLRFWVLVNVAGVDYEGLFYERSRQQIRAILRLNIEATLEVTHALLELRDPLSTFRIVNVASLAAFAPMPAKATYAASKRFLLDFSIALGEEVRGLGATVTALCPAGMPTTPEIVRAIEAQGWIGQITTQDTGRVAALTLDAALKGRRVVVPGIVNRFLHSLGSLAPATWSARLLGKRWQAARRLETNMEMVRAQPHPSP
jgi:short-subunit dehydrogenase